MGPSKGWEPSSKRAMPTCSPALKQSGDAIGSRLASCVQLRSRNCIHVPTCQPPSEGGTDVSVPRSALCVDAVT